MIFPPQRFLDLHFGGDKVSWMIMDHLRVLDQWVVFMTFFFFNFIDGVCKRFPVPWNDAKWDEESVADQDINRNNK